MNYQRNFYYYTSSYTSKLLRKNEFSLTFQGQGHPVCGRFHTFPNFGNYNEFSFPLNGGVVARVDSRL
jgi:hypothetical protein